MTAELEGIYRPEVLKTIEEKIDEISGDLRELSIKIHGTVRSFTHLMIILN
jgi:hypothetical protein